mgnify:CR=1 FL=1
METEPDDLNVEEGPASGTFENLRVWQDAVELAVLVHTTYRSCPDFDLRAQVKRAALSVSSNIAEGYERSSNSEFVRYLDIARGSCGEVRSQTHVAVRVGLLSQAEANVLLMASRELSMRIARLMQVRRERFG